MRTRIGYLDTMFLKAVIVLIGVCVVSFLLGEPHLEGRNATATLYEIYFHDPFLAYAYVASLSFFVALYHVFKMIGYAESDRLFSQDAIKTVRAIRGSFKTPSSITSCKQDGEILRRDARVFRAERVVVFDIEAS